MRKFLAATLSTLLVAGSFPIPSFAADPPTKTPIKHVVVIFGENISFDHYFATYPTAQNNAGETPFTYTHIVNRTINNKANNLVTPLDPTNHFQPITGLDLLHNNPNGPTGSGAAFNGANAANPFRLSPSQAATADMGHNYKPEQAASDNGAMDHFPGSTGTAGPPPSVESPSGAEATKGLVMGYFDGNSATAMWNYANYFALNDNSFTTTFGPSTPGAINLISGQTNGFAAFTNVVSGGVLLHGTHEAADGQGGYTLIGDGDPLGDVCSNTSIDNVQMAGKNIGDLLNAKGITWGWFEGGFDLTVTNPNGTTGCARSSVNRIPGYGGVATADYIPHHEPFQYYASTANPTHARPSSVAAIGSSFETDGITPDPANHQYDSNDFFHALSNGNLPSVSFLKAPGYEDGHPGYSDPLDEQTFIVHVINALVSTPFWESTAVFLAYDDSDGWYDHQMSPIVNPSHNASVDVLNGPGTCIVGLQQWWDDRITDRVHPMLGALGKPVQGRCGYGTRVPLLLVSPWAKADYVDHTLTDQTSILRFIEDNFLNSQRIQPGGSFDTVAKSLDSMFYWDTPAGYLKSHKLTLNPSTGEIVK